MRTATGRDGIYGQGDSVTEVMLLLGFVAITWVTVDSLEQTAAADAVDLERGQLALALASAHSDIASGMPFEDLPLADEFEPASWVRLPDLARGEIPIDVSRDGVADPTLIYAVSYRAEELDMWGDIRRITVRVVWDKADQTQGEYLIESVLAS